MRFFGRSIGEKSSKMADVSTESIAHKFACDRLAQASTIDAIIAILRDAGRAVVGSDGITVIRRDGDEVVYVTEDAVSALWSGQRFPIRTCVSGMAIQARAPIVIPDILIDQRVPLNAYLSTFVRSMVVVPVGHDDPQMAIGAYWQSSGPVGSSTVERLILLAAAAAMAIERVERQFISPRQPACPREAA